MLTIDSNIPNRVVYSNESEWRQRVIDALEMVYTDSCPGGQCPSASRPPGHTHDIPTQHVKNIMKLVRGGGRSRKMAILVSVPFDSAAA